MRQKIKIYVIIFLLICFNISASNTFAPLQIKNIIIRTISPKKIKVKKDITVENYFQFLDSIVIKYDSLTNYKLTEHLQFNVCQLLTVKVGLVNYKAKVNLNF